MPKKRITPAAANAEYNSLPNAAKEIFTYFINSLQDNSFVRPDHFYADRDPKGYLENIKAAKEITNVATVAAVKATIDICHKRIHSFWGTMCPVLRMATLIKAYNGLLGDGGLKSVIEDKKSAYGKDVKEY